MNPFRNPDPPEQDDAREPAAVDTTADTAEPMQALAAERDRLIEEKNSLFDQLRRKQADFDNYRKRTDRERRDYVQYAAMDVVRELLPVLDALERALATGLDAPQEFRTGVEHIARQLSDTLARFGLEPIHAKGERFDPHLHQAVESVETDDYEDHTVIDEWQRGYMFKGKLLRPAMVKVAVRPPERNAPGSPKSNGKSDETSD